jgi:hypothetical protein
MGASLSCGEEPVGGGLVPVNRFASLGGKTARDRRQVMDPVDEFARLKAEIARLQARAEVLRAGFLAPDARLRSNRFEVTVRRQKRRLFCKDRLPPDILSDPRFWEERESEIVTCRALDRKGGDDDLVLIE